MSRDTDSRPFGAVRWVRVTPSEAARENTPMAQLSAGQNYKLQQKVPYYDGCEEGYWADVGVEE